MSTSFFAKTGGRPLQIMADQNQTTRREKSVVQSVAEGIALNILGCWAELSPEFQTDVWTRWPMSLFCQRYITRRMRGLSEAVVVVRREKAIAWCIAHNRNPFHPITNDGEGEAWMLVSDKELQGGGPEPNDGRIWA